MSWIFGLFLVAPCAFTSCHVVISKQDSTIRALRSHRCATGMGLRHKNHGVRFRQSVENRSRARDTQPIRGVSDDLARGCKHWHPQVPGRRYGKKKSSLWAYVSLPISHTPQNHQPFSRIKCESYIFIKKCVCSFTEVRKLCFIILLCGYTIELAFFKASVKHFTHPATGTSFDKSNHLNL